MKSKYDNFMYHPIVDSYDRWIDDDEREND